MQKRRLLSILVVLFSLNACAAAPATKAESAEPAKAENAMPEKTTEVVKFVTKGAPAYFVNDQQNPELTFKRGTTYQIEVNTPGHPLWIKTNESPGIENAYASGITGNGTDKGTITFVVPKDAPATLFYNCQFHVVMHGKINITD